MCMMPMTGGERVRFGAIEGDQTCYMFVVSYLQPTELTSRMLGTLPEGSHLIGSLHLKRTSL